jgi:methylthioribulose 1-phosphate dehydratase/enolase-phosphatase E1
MYVWGDSWEQAKIHAECYDYLLETALKARELGVDVSAKPQFSTYQGKAAGKREASGEAVGADSGKREKRDREFSHVLLDIEGTTTPISFVKATLFPYSEQRLKEFLTAHWPEERVKALVAELIGQWGADNADPSLSLPAEIQCPAAGNEPAAIIDALEAYLIWNIKLDRKVAPLKKLQGWIWEEGYAAGSLKSIVYEDVSVAMRRLNAAGVKVSIYSSGSKQAQQLLFKYSDQGDLRPLLSNYFDTKVGQKQEVESYREVLLSVGLAEDPSKLLFITDIVGEARAARAAGMSVKIAMRPGNAPLPALEGGEHFDLVEGFDSL